MSKTADIFSLKARAKTLINTGIRKTAPKKDRPAKDPLYTNAIIFVPRRPIAVNNMHRHTVFQTGI